MCCEKIRMTDRIVDGSFWLWQANEYKKYLPRQMFLFYCSNYIVIEKTKNVYSPINSTQKGFNEIY